MFDEEDVFVRFRCRLWAEGSMFVRCCHTHSKHPPKYRFGPCVLPLGSDSFSHVVELRPLRRFTLRSPCRTHPSGRIRRIPNVSALSQGLHTFRLLGTHASVGSMGNESHGYFTFPFFTFLLNAFMSHSLVQYGYSPHGQCLGMEGVHQKI